MRCASYIGLLALSLAAVAQATDSTAQAKLKSLTAYFSEARLLPSGSRPRPPEVDLEALSGLQASAIKDALGSPDYQGKNYPSLTATLRNVGHSAMNLKRHPLMIQ